MAKQKTTQVNLFYFIGGYGIQVFRLALALCLLVMLVTYNPNDGGFFTTTVAANQIHNAIGIIGAYFADLFVHLIGASAYILPLFFIVLALQTFLNVPH